MDRRRKTTPERIRKLYFEEKLPVRAIAAMTGISTQRVYQILADLKGEREEASA